MTTTAVIASHPSDTGSSCLAELLRGLRTAFGCGFHIVDLETGERIHRCPQLPSCDVQGELPLMQSAAHTGQPQFLADADSVLLFALPLTQATNLPWVAVAPFVTRAVSDESLVEPSRLLGVSPAEGHAWIHAQPQWPAHALERLGREFLARVREQRRTDQLDRELEKVSESLSTSYEEISLLHHISQNFRLSSSDEELGVLALSRLRDCAPILGAALVYLPVAHPNDTTYPARIEPRLLVSGECPLATTEAILTLVESLEANRHARPLVVNAVRSDLTPLLSNGVRQLIVAPMLEGARVFGYLLAFNHTLDKEFGNVEANLLASVSSMIGVHCSNRDLYRLQDEFLASVVRALTSAIDAKDPYTCGHSDRVARLATCIARQLGCDTHFLATIYMAGLLHDIGKIGIDDAVLRKPGRLTAAEFEHIKQHPALGYKILADIKHFAPVLPAVLHHHEQWDGEGYPCRLAGEQIPFIARIVAVADAYDAMTSDRPYRPGMPEERVQTIFRDGAGRQWDPEVIRAFFQVYDEIRAIVEQERAGLSLDIETWLS